MCVSASWNDSDGKYCTVPVAKSDLYADLSGVTAITRALSIVTLFVGWLSTVHLTKMMEFFVGVCAAPDIVVCDSKRVSEIDVENAEP